jgi:hypothetical protein
MFSFFQRFPKRRVPRKIKLVQVITARNGQRFMFNRRALLAFLNLRFAMGNFIHTFQMGFRWGTSFTHFRRDSDGELHSHFRRDSDCCSAWKEFDCPLSPLSSKVGASATFGFSLTSTRRTLLRQLFIHTTMSIERSIKSRDINIPADTELENFSKFNLMKDPRLIHGNLVTYVK